MTIQVLIGAGGILFFISPTVIWVGIFSSRDIFKKVLTVSRII